MYFFKNPHLLYLPFEKKKGLNVEIHHNMIICEIDYTFGIMIVFLFPIIMDLQGAFCNTKYKFLLWDGQ